MGKKFSRRDFLRLGALSAAGAAVAACTPKSAPDDGGGETKPDTKPVEEEAVNFQYWQAWGGYCAAWDLIAALPEYEEYLGKNTVECKGGVGGDAFLTAVAGGSPPDAASHPSGQYLD